MLFIYPHAVQAVQIKHGVNKPVLIQFSVLGKFTKNLDNPKDWEYVSRVAAETHVCHLQRHI